MLLEALSPAYMCSWGVSKSHPHYQDGSKFKFFSGGERAKENSYVNDRNEDRGSFTTASQRG